MLRTFFATLSALAFALTLTTSPTLALTTAEVEQTWANIGQVSGTFTESYDDGGSQSGTFVVYDPTLVVLTYNNGSMFAVNGGPSRKVGPMTAASDNATVFDSFNGATQNYDLGPFRQLLRSNPDLSQVLAGTGETDTKLTMRLRDPRAPNRGYVDITFSKKTGKMLHWNSVIDGIETVTKFKY